MNEIADSGFGEMLKDAAQLIDGHGIIYTRFLAAPVEHVWQTVSTSEGLQKWWLGGKPSYTIDLRVGGLFQHHWKSTVTDFEANSHIDFRNEPAMGGGMMRVEVKAVGDGTQFCFIDHGPPPAGPAAGWHCMIDELEMCTTGKHFDFGDPPDATGRYPAGSRADRLMRFYERYMADHTRRLEWLRETTRR